MLGSAPGAILSVKTADWHYIKSFGTADPGTGAPIGCATPFQIGSNTKMMTAVVLLQLVEEGALKLDDPLSLHLPKIAARLPFGSKITLRNLARHTAGVFSYSDNAPDGTPGLLEGDMTDPAALKRGYVPQDLVEFAVRHGKPGFSPDAAGAWSYSNTGYILLGMVIEKAERKPLAKIFRARIFKPLEMKKSYLWNNVPTPALGLPRAYVGPPYDVEMTDWNLSQGWAAGAVISTATDMHIFIEALIGGALFKRQETIAMMQDTVPSTLVAMPDYGIGLGRKAAGFWGHGGQTPGFASDVAFQPDQRVSVVAWGTSANNAMALGVALTADALQKAGVLPKPADAAGE